MSCDPSKTCSICDQRGLPILPLRYAVARCDSKVKDRAPELQAPFGDGVEDIVLPSDSAQYTLRLLRPGYLYVFNQVRGEWKAYVVNDDAYLTEFDIHSKTPPDTGEAQPCERMQNSAAGRCVMIPDAADAGPVWLGFSDTAWTAAVLEKHRQQAYRDRHMQRIDVGKWAQAKAAPATQPHMQRLDKIGEQVCEFALPAAEQPPPPADAVHDDNPGDGVIRLATITVVARRYRAMDFSLHDYYNEHAKTDSVVEAATTAAGDFVPAMVALNDPAGITMELARLPAARLENFISEADVARPLAVSSAIESLRTAIKDDAENRQIYRTERAAQRIRYGGYGGMGATGARGGQALAELLMPEIGERRDALYEDMRNPSAELLLTARNSAWKDYADQYDEGRRSAWEQQWHARLRAFDRAVVAPLVRAHVAWVAGTGLFEQFDCNHDPDDSHSGQGFVDTLLLCIQDTQQYNPCADQYRQWLQATDIQRDNLVLRALAYNQKAMIEQLNAVAQGGLQPDSLKGLPWDGLIKGYEEPLEALADGGKNAVVRLSAALGGPIADLAGKAVDGMVGPGLVALGVIAKAPVVMVDVTMSKADAIAELTGRMMAVNPKVGDLHDLNRAIEIQLRKARIYGTPVAGTGRFRYLLMTDPRVISDFPGVDAEGTPTGRRFAEHAILTEADRTRLTRLRWNKLLPGAAGLGVVTGILQAVALGKLAEDMDKSMAHEANENTWRYRTSIAALAGTLAETTGKWSESAAAVGSRLAVRLERYVGLALRVGGKALGIGAGVVMAVWDGIRGWQEIQEGNAVGWLYIGSAVAGVGAMLAFSTLGPLLFGAAATGVGIVLVVLVVVIAVLIEVFKDNKVQDWLERCYFGEFEEVDRYRSPALEMNELKIALAG
ncbi:T6SS effector BTH_I2691 family protein [Lysobacter sp. F6437]|uniref:T6SS effector BTH_I2691 family protein n=1 Tax=Lysobacter sp. F6437 TaxID=3459296 RepID=UPI00403D708E